MTAPRILALGLLAILGGVALAQDVKRPGILETKLESPLVSADIAAKLNLAGDQKDKIAKIEKEYADKMKGTDSKIKEALEKAKKDRNRAAYKDVQDQIQTAKNQRQEFAGKVNSLLNDDQKKIFDDKKEPGAARRPATASGGPVPFLLPQIQDRLELTADQKEKLSALQKEFESNSLKILTDEQRKKVEDFKARRVEPRKKPTE